MLDIEVVETIRGGGSGRRGGGGGGGHGFHEWLVSTDRGKRRLHLYNVKESISVNSAGTVLMTDIEKNRYKIGDASKLPPKARRVLDDMLL
ncbi:MAG: DUF1854 domain-containing protein [Victivallales bacterium]|nr:DUF1854 domain-containing protein [Victivallales bacterium]